MASAASGSDYCFEEAGREYGISPEILYAIASVESGFNARAFNRNANGSFDVGVMQINSGWYRTLGHEAWMGLGDPCQNIRTGAWILRRCMDRHGYTWDAVGCYNAAGRDKRRAYSRKVYAALEKIRNGGRTASYRQPRNEKGEGDYGR